MKINTNSWHYRFYQYVNTGNAAYNLCQYMQWVMLGIFMFVVWTAMVVGAVIMNVMQIAAISTLGFKHIIPDFFPVNVITVVLIVVYLWYRYHEYQTVKEIRYYNNNQYEPYKEKQYGVIATWLKDKHAKVCRNIEFSDK